MRRRDCVAAGLALAAGGAWAQGGVAYPAGSYKPWRPWTVLQGQLKTWEMTRGVNTIPVSGGMVVEQALPPSPQHVYRIKPGQAIALLYQASRVEGERRTPVWGAFPSQWAKIIRKVDGQTVELKDYPGVLSEWHNTALYEGLHGQADMDHRFTGRLNPPLTRADQWRTHGAWVFHSPGFAPWLQVGTRQGKADVAALRGQLLTVHFLAHERDDTPWITLEVDFTAWASEPAAATEPAPASGPPVRESAAERRAQQARERAKALLGR